VKPKWNRLFIFLRVSFANLALKQISFSTAKISMMQNSGNARCASFLPFSKNPSEVVEYVRS
jgi:hypothetical protein